MRGWEGTVRLQLSLEADGKVAAAGVYASSGHPVLDRSALLTARAWVIPGTASRVVVVPVAFELVDE